jgi:hypothetical protein
MLKSRSLARQKDACVKRFAVWDNQLRSGEQTGAELLDLGTHLDEVLAA